MLHSITKKKKIIWKLFNVWIFSINGLLSSKKYINLPIKWVIMRSKHYWRNTQLLLYSSWFTKYNLKTYSKKISLKTIEFKLLKKNKVINKNMTLIKIPSSLQKDNIKEKYQSNWVAAILLVNSQKSPKNKLSK
jgi:hypothetical protein